MFLVFGVVALVAVTAGFIVFQQSKSSRGRDANGAGSSTRRSLDGLGYPVLHDVKLVGQNRSVIRIDHVVRLPASVVIVSVNPPGMAGPIRGQADALRWWIGNPPKNRAVPNPTLSQRSLLTSLRNRYPLIRIRGLVVVGNGVSFPEGPPKGAIRAAEVRSCLDQMAKQDGTASKAVDTAWMSIQRLVETSARRIVSR